MSLLAERCKRVHHEDKRKGAPWRVNHCANGLQYSKAYGIFQNAELVQVDRMVLLEGERNKTETEEADYKPIT